MTDVNTKLLRQLPDGVIYADPANPNFTVRFKTTSQPKSLNGLSTTNRISEIIYNDLNEVTIGAATGIDPLSVRLRVSGSVESHDRLVEIINGLAGQVATWNSQDVLKGFTPTTVPVNPQP